MLEAMGLARNYGSTRALSDFTLSARPGQIIGLVGPNGAGKTTALRILACIDRPDSGSLHIAGTDALIHPDLARNSIGYMPEQFPFDPDIRVSEYLDFVASIRGLAGQQKYAALDSVTGICELGEVRSKLMGSLSKGYRQRVSLAQALVHQPRLLILDEPASGMDPIQASRFRDTLSALRKTRTIIFSTHQLSDAESVCDEIHVVSAGMLKGRLENSAVRAPGFSKKDPVGSSATRDPDLLLKDYGNLVSRPAADTVEAMQDQNDLPEPDSVFSERTAETTGQKTPSLLSHVQNCMDLNLNGSIKTATAWYPDKCPGSVDASPATFPEKHETEPMDPHAVSADQWFSGSSRPDHSSTLNSFLALVRRECNYYLHSPALWIVAALQLAISAGWLFFGREYFASGVASLSGWFASLPFILTVTYSLLFSRIWSEEFKLGSFDLLAGYPVRNSTLIMGKYAGSVAAACISLFPLSVLPLAVASVSPLDPVRILAGFAGILLFSFFVIAIINFASSLTSSSAVAFSFSAGSVIAFLMIEKIGYWAGTIPIISVMAMRLSASRHLLSFFRGAIDSYDVLYFLLISVLALFCTELSLEKRRA